MSDGTVKIDSLPADNELYVVKSYGGLIKNHSLAPDIPLIRVTFNKVQNNSIKTHSKSYLVGLPELSTVRLGTIWQNQSRLEGYWSKYKNYEEHIPLSFDLKKYPAKSVRYTKVQYGNRTKLIPAKVDDSKKTLEDEEDKFYGSTFTEFTSDNGIKYIVSSIELLMSTYVPKNKLIRNDLLSHDLNIVMQKYIKDYSYTDETYTIYLDKILEEETMAFLAYLACNKKSRANISKIWGSVEGNGNSNERHITVLPYHPETISFNASGMWLDKNTFYIQRIYKPKPPADKKFQFFAKRAAVTPKTNDELDVDTDRSTEDDRPQSTLNQHEIEKQTSIVHNRNPGGKAGTKYIVSEVMPDNKELDIEIKEDIEVNDNDSSSYKQEKKDVKAASSGKLSGANESEKIAMTKYVVEEDPKRLDYALEIENSLEELANQGTIKNIKYIDDFAVEHDQLVYSSFSQDHIGIEGNNNWASGQVKGSGISRARAGYRKLLIIKIEIDALKPFYIVEIIRKVPSDKFKGILFQISQTLELSTLEDIKYVIAVNKGHFNKGKKSFPVGKSALYKHSWGDMKKRFENVFESMKKKNIFD